MNLQLLIPQNSQNYHCPYGFNSVLKHQYLIVQPEIEQESYYFAPISVVIFGIHLITCDSFLFFLYLSKGAILSVHNLHSLYHATLWDERCCNDQCCFCSLPYCCFNCGKSDFSRKYGFHSISGKEITWLHNEIPQSSYPLLLA